VLGFRLHGETLTIDPVLPEEWPGFEITFRYRSTTYEIAVRKDAPGPVIAVESDGRPLEGVSIHLIDDGQVHRVTVNLPQRPAIASKVSQYQALPSNGSRVPAMDSVESEPYRR